MRYFIIFYTGFLQDGRKAIGNVNFESEVYPNRYKIIDLIIEDNKLQLPEHTTISVNNIIELNKEDYLSYIETPNIDKT